MGFPTWVVRLVVLWTALAVIVGASYLIRESAAVRTINAMQWVSHSHEVRETVFELMWSLNEMQGAVIASRVTGAPAAASARYAFAHQQYRVQLDALRNLTLDSAEQ